MKLRTCIQLQSELKELSKGKCQEWIVININITIKSINLIQSNLSFNNSIHKEEAYATKTHS